MGIGIASFFGKMFGTEKAVDTMITQVSKAADALIYTKEEKAQDIATATSEFRTMLVEWMKNTEGQNLARRFISIIVSGTWVIEHLVSAVIGAMSGFMSNPALWLQASDRIDFYADKTTGAMMLVLGFYFAAPHLGTIVDGAMNKFGGKKADK